MGTSKKGELWNRFSLHRRETWIPVSLMSPVDILQQPLLIMHFLKNPWHLQIYSNSISVKMG